MKLISQFHNGARVRRKISYADFATLSRQKAAQYTLAGSAAILVDRDKDTWQIVTIDDTAPNRIPTEDVTSTTAPAITIDANGTPWIAANDKR